MNNSGNSPGCHSFPRSSTHTAWPALAQRLAAIEPPYPEPTTTISYCGFINAWSKDSVGNIGLKLGSGLSSDCYILKEFTINSPLIRHFYLKVTDRTEQTAFIIKTLQHLRSCLFVLKTNYKSI